MTRSARKNRKHEDHEGRGVWLNSAATLPRHRGKTSSIFAIAFLTIAFTYEHIAAWQDERIAKLVRTTGGLEDMPMIVLTQGRGPRGWIELQQQLAQRSRRGRQIVLTGIGHGIPEQAPEAIVKAVREIVDEIRTRK